MSEELRGSHYGANDEPGDEVEAHGSHYGQNDEAGDEVEGHGSRAGLNQEPAEEEENDVEAHRFPNVRLDSPSNS
jgi:hypothetical protein